LNINLQFDWLGSIRFSLLFVECQQWVGSDYSLPQAQIKACQVEAFAKTLKNKLLAKDSAIAKSYLGLLVDKIVVNENTATITGSYSAAAHAAALDKIKIAHLKQVPTSISNWGG
jgi:hypothetical protein